MDHKQNHPNHKNMMDQERMIHYLDQFGKQINNRKINNFTLQEQLRSISQAYKQAQEKLLQVEKALSSQSFIAEKQRSVIQIYKYILNEDMAEQDILTFLQRLEEDEENTEIFDELGAIKMMLNMKKLKYNKKTNQTQKQLRQLKKEISSLNTTKLQNKEQSIYLSHQNLQLKEELESVQQELLNVQKKVKELLVLNQQQSREINEYKEQKYNYQRQLKEKNKKMQQSKGILEKHEENNKILTEFHGNLKSKLMLETSIQKEKQFFRQIQDKVQKLLKYKKEYKTLKFNIQNHQFLQRQVILLKLYLNDQSLELFKEFQAQKLDCIQNEIRNLSILQKNRLIRLEECEREVWKYKIQLIKCQEYQNNEAMSNRSFINQTMMNKTMNHPLTNRNAILTQKTKVNLSKQTSGAPQTQSNTHDNHKDYKHLVQSFRINNEPQQFND